MTRPGIFESRPFSFQKLRTRPFSSPEQRIYCPQIAGATLLRQKISLCQYARSRLNFPLPPCESPNRLVLPRLGLFILIHLHLRPDTVFCLAYHSFIASPPISRFVILSDQLRISRYLHHLPVMQDSGQCIREGEQYSRIRRSCRIP